MFSRVTQLEVDPVRASVEGAFKVFSEQVLPELTKQPGYEARYEVLVAADPPEG